MGKFTDVFGSSVIATIYNEAASNRIPYLGEGFFPAKQKSGLNLKWIKTSKGLPVSLAPSAFDVVAPIRSRQGLEVIDTEMAYFKEAMLVKEQDIQDYLDTEDYIGAAGSYRIQRSGYKLIDEIDGSFSNVIGIPLERLAEVLEE